MFNKIYIEITNICNLKCKFCIPCNRGLKYMSVSEFEEVCKKICKYTNMIALHVKGEPLMHKDLESILEVASKYNLGVSITTNGTLLKSRINILKNSDCVKQINVSLHSMTQNDLFNKSYLKDVFDSVRELNNINISYRLWNLESIKDNDVNDYIISYIEEYYGISSLKETLKFNDYFKICDNIFINQDIEFTWPCLGGDVINTSGRCLALKNQVAILVDGSVVPCCLDNNGDIKLGNIFESDFESIINSEFASLIKTNFSNGVITCDLCKTCGFLKRLESKRKEK